MKHLIVSFISSFLIISSSFATLLESEKRTIKIYEDVSKSVVSVSNIQTRRGFFFSSVDVPRGAGTGFIWDREGHIVTNYHVAQGASKFTITFHNDPKQYKAIFVGGEKKKDIAVLKLVEKPSNLVPMKIGKSNNLLVGQMALAIGNPFGLAHSMSKGIISALDRKIDGLGGVKIHGMIQTDAAINQGNSGGPLLNSDGQLIGMNTMIFSTSGSSAGLGFAVPVDTISQIAPQIVKYGKVIRPTLGIGILPDNVRNYYWRKKGVPISYIDPNGAAGKAGLKGMQEDDQGRVYIGDVITRVQNTKVNTFSEIYNALDKFKIGDTIELHYIRGGKKKSKKVKLEASSR
jgi:S1-C subfamily serine protease